MLNTKTVKGPFLYFQYVYFLTTVTSLIAVFHRPTSLTFRHKVQKMYDREFVIKNSFGTFSVNAKNDSLTKSITSFEYTHQDWLSTPREKNTFIDIGANIGFYSMLSLHKYDYQRAHAFEPNPSTFARLQKNVQLNALNERLNAYQCGLSDTVSTAKLGTKDIHTGGSSFILSENRKVDHIVEVPTITFDTFATKESINVPDISFIKIDVEGFEYNVLNGMTTTLKNVLPCTCIFIEIHPHAQYAQETKSLLEQLGFSLIKSGRQHNFLYKK